MSRSVFLTLLTCRCWTPIFAEQASPKASREVWQQEHSITSAPLAMEHPWARGGQGSTGQPTDTLGSPHPSQGHDGPVHCHSNHTTTNSTLSLLTQRCSFLSQLVPKTLEYLGDSAWIFCCSRSWTCPKCCCRTAACQAVAAFVTRLSLY